jgi:hypothetical protein
VRFLVDKVALGQVFSEYFGFPCQFSFHRLLHIHHHLSTGAGIIGQLVTDVKVDSVSPHLKKTIVIIGIEVKIITAVKLCKEFQRSFGKYP